MKQSLVKAQPVYLRFKEQVMRVRKEVQEQKMQDFVQKKGEELQQKIIEEARSELKKIENLRKVKEADEKRKKQMEERMRQNKEDPNKEVDEDGDPTAWRTNTRPAAAPQQTREGETARPPRREEEDGFLSRGAMGSQKPVEEVRKPLTSIEDSGPMRRPAFTKQARKPEDEDTGFISRGAMGTQKKEEEKKTTTGFGEAPSRRPFEDRKDAGATATGPWRSSAAQKSTTEAKAPGTGTAPTGDRPGGFTRGPPR